MKQVWKYQVAAKIRMQIGAKILCAQEQNGAICIWAEVDPQAATEERAFEVFGTGHPMQESVRVYIGTAMMEGGSLVFHVYEASA